MIEFQLAEICWIDIVIINREINTTFLKELQL